MNTLVFESVLCVAEKFLSPTLTSPNRGGRLLCEAAKNDITAANYWLWIINHVGTNNDWMDIDRINSDGYSGCTRDLLAKTLGGALYFTLTDTNGMGDPFTLVHGYTQQQLINMLNNVVRQNFSEPTYAYDESDEDVWEAFDAVYAVADALNRTEAALMNGTKRLFWMKYDPYNKYEFRKEDIFPLLLKSLASTNFTGAKGLVAFDPETGHRQVHASMKQFGAGLDYQEVGTRYFWSDQIVMTREFVWWVG